MHFYDSFDAQSNRNADVLYNAEMVILPMGML